MTTLEREWEECEDYPVSSIEKELVCENRARMWILQIPAWSDLFVDSCSLEAFGRSLNSETWVPVIIKGLDGNPSECLTWEVINFNKCLENAFFLDLIT